jgi:hypothetical protein
MADMADMAVTADMVVTADITADTADITAHILARYRREADTSSAETGRPSAAANREHTVIGTAANGAAVTGAAATGAAATGAATTGAAVTGAAVTGAATTGAATTGAAVTDSSSSADLVIRTTGIGTPLGAGAFLTRLTTAIILTGIILRMGTIMLITVAPHQGGDSLAPDPSRNSHLRTRLRRTEYAVIANLFVDLSVG